MAFIQISDKEFIDNLRTIDKKHFASEFYNVSGLSLVGVAYNLTKLLEYYKLEYKARPYEARIFYIYALAYMDTARQRIPENKAMMDNIFANLEQLLDLAEALQGTPTLEDWEPEE